MCIGLAAVGAAQSVESQQTYKVKKKDTVYGIARKYNISIDELLSANPGAAVVHCSGKTACRIL